MNWMTIAWPMVAAACLTLALVNLGIAFGRTRRALPHFFFFLNALAVAAVAGLELAALRTDDLGRYQALLRWAQVPLWLMAVSLLGFVWSFFGTGHKWLALLAAGLNTIALIANFAAPTPVRYAVSIRQLETFGGVKFTVADFANGPWNLVELASIAALLAFVVNASIALWRKGERRRAATVGAAIVLFLFASRAYASLVEAGVVRTPYFFCFAYLGVLIAMGRELGDEVLRAAKLARELRESEQRIDLAARAAALGFWTWDIPRDEIWATQTARMLFGFGPSEQLDLGRFFDALHPEDRVAVKQAIDKALAGGPEYEKEYRVQLPDGDTRWIAARGRAEIGVTGQVELMRGVVLDITSRRRSELELQRVRSQLAHVGRVSMMGQLAAALGHELSQPLGAILRNAEAAELFLQNSDPDLEELRAIVNDIRRDDERAAEVIDRLRGLLQRGDLKFCPVVMDELLDGVVALMRAEAAARSVTLEIITALTLPMVNGDRVHIQQVLLNLLLNAMDAVNGAQERERRVTLCTSCNGGEAVEVSVSDTGDGISAEKRAHVFEPFFTTKAQGMGMGLAISRTIIEAHGGRLWLEDNIGKRGTTFRFTLPVVEKGSTS